MKKRNLVLQAAVALALFGGAAGVAGAATITVAAATDFALETAQPTTQWTLPETVYTVGAGGAATQDFYVTFTLTNGAFAATATAQVASLNAGTSTATLIDGGGVGQTNATFRINGSAVPIAPNDQIVLCGQTNVVVTDTACAAANTVTSPAANVGTPIRVAAANGLLFIGGSVASPVESPAAAADVATFTQAVTVAMAETGTEPIDLNPTPTTNSRLVFGPAAALDVAVGTSPAEASNLAARQLAITIGTQKEPNGAAFADVIDDLLVSLAAPFDTTAISAATGQGLCLDDNDNNACDAGETFNLTTGAATIAGGSWATNGGFLLFNNGTAFAPRSLGLNYALSVKTNAARPGMTAHQYNYSAVANNAWNFAYANGTLLRSQWFLSDAANNSTMRLVNAGTVGALVVDAKYYLDNGATGNVVGLTTVNANSGKNLAINATSIPGLAAGTASRGYIEVVIAGDLTNVDGSMITYGLASGDRTIAVMRNVTFDTGVRSNAAF